MIKTATALTAAAALTFGVAAAASADSIGVKDPDDSPHGSDLRAVRVEHGEKNVVVVTSHDDLRRSPASGSGGSVYLDTDAADPGPEFVVVGGYFEGTDYVLLTTEGFGQKKWGDPVEGTYRMTVKYGLDRVRTVISRATLGNPDEVRVAVRVSGPGAGTVDWLGQPRSYTTWVAQG